MSLMFLFASFEKWDFMHVFRDLLFFVVYFDSNAYEYDNVVCVNKKYSVWRLGMHFWVWQ
jgi:hypothetical protein